MKLYAYRKYNEEDVFWTIYKHTNVVFLGEIELQEPKKTVVKEQLVKDFGLQVVPANAKNIKITYEVEE